MDIGKVASGIIIFFIGLVEVLLGFRFIFMLLAANSTAQFSSWVYASTDTLVAPFQGVFPSFGAAQFTLELGTVLAMVVYGVGGFVFLQLTKYFEGMIVKPKMPSPAASQSAPQPTYMQPQAPTIIQPQTPIVQLPPQQPMVAQPTAYTPAQAPQPAPQAPSAIPMSFNDSLSQMPTPVEQPLNPPVQSTPAQPLPPTNY